MKLEIIHEGLRFGSKEFRTIDRYSDNIIVGVEYEFHLDEGFDESNGISDIDEISSIAYARASEEIEKLSAILRNDIIDEYVSDRMPELEDILDNLYNVYEIINGNKEFVLNSIINVEENTEKNINDVLNFIYESDLLANLELLYGSIVSYEKNYDIYVLDEYMDLIRLIEGFIDELRRIVDNENGNDISDISRYFEDFLESDLPPEDIAFSEIESELKKRSESFSDEVFNITFNDIHGFDPDNIVDSEIYAEIYHSLVEELYNPTDEVYDIIKERFQNSNFVKSVEEDSSVDHGVEVISKAIPMDKQFELMEEMFEFIENIGSTSERTGMHVNMSIKGLDFSKESFNPVKLLMLVSDKYYQIDKKYKPRQYTSPMFEEFDMRDFIELAFSYIDDGFSGLEDTLFEIGKFKKKSQAINFIHMDTKISGTNRIEFRYFGGEGYERRYDELVKDIKYVAYCMMAAYSPTFANKEYYNSLIRRLDKLVREKKNIIQKYVNEENINTFLKFVDLVKKNRSEYSEM